MADLAIVNGMLAPPGPGAEAEPGTLLLDGGRIEAVLSPGEAVAADRILDASGLLVMPGAIDIHFHCRAPGFPERGDFASESRAAAVGGVTTIFEMPISKPCASTTEVWKARRDLASRDAYVNIGIYAAPGRLDRAEIEGMAAAGAIAFKLFTTETVRGREDEFLGLSTPDLGDIFRALELVRETGLRCTFHAEEQRLIDLFSGRARAFDGPDHLRHLRSRPGVVEAASAAQLITLAEWLDTPIHLAHVSARATVDVVRAARARGVKVSAETCPHYLHFTEEVLAEVGPFGKINPPLRCEEDREALWEAVQEGVIDVIATDHAPFTVAEKQAAWGDILSAPPGHPGVEQLVPLMMNEALNGRLELSQVVNLISTRPAQLFGLYPDKGVLRAGADADLTLYDPRPRTVIDRCKGFSRGAGCNWLYHGLEVQGEVAVTIVGGKTVFKDGDMQGSPGDGAIVRPRSQKQ
ncbi:MAG: dihydroorotase family protein [Truepera sp.]|nr:dihydroorotase family protein [Truepera sp.]